VEYLRHRETVLALDNCEHLVETCAALVDELLRRCPRLHILATSREPFRLDGETIQAVSRESRSRSSSPRFGSERYRRRTCSSGSPTSGSCSIRFRSSADQMEQANTLVQLGTAHTFLGTPIVRCHATGSAEDLGRLVAEGMKPLVSEVHPLDDVAKALEALAGRRAVGKVVVRVRAEPGGEA